MGNKLSTIRIKRYKSLKESHVEMQDLNVLIGANAAGKSNFLSLFTLVQNILNQKLQYYVIQKGGPDNLLHFGRKTSTNFEIELQFRDSSYYEFILEPTPDNQMVFVREVFARGGAEYNQLQIAHLESNLPTTRENNFHPTLKPMKGWYVYHFHDTSQSSRIKQLHNIDDNLFLHPDAGNLAAFLYLLNKKHPLEYDFIVKTVRLVAPFFDNFILRPHPHNEDLIELEWKDKRNNTPWNAHLLSDGTLRFICLATLLLQPAIYQPEIIIIDEPELGLNPYAIDLLGGILRSVSKQSQIIITTQATGLLNCFSPNDVIVVDRINGVSTLRRLDESELGNWLEDFSLGHLWEMNVIGGRPAQ